MICSRYKGRYYFKGRTIISERGFVSVAFDGLSDGVAFWTDKRAAISGGVLRVPVADFPEDGCRISVDVADGEITRHYDTEILFRRGNVLSVQDMADDITYHVLCELASTERTLDEFRGRIAALEKLCGGYRLM